MYPAVSVLTAFDQTPLTRFRTVPVSELNSQASPFRIVCVTATVQTVVPLGVLYVIVGFTTLPPLATIRIVGRTLASPSGIATAEVVKLIAEAHTNKQIAEILGLSEKTVESHRSNILNKLGMSDRVELVRYAVRRGLIEA